MQAAILTRHTRTKPSPVSKSRQDPIRLLVRAIRDAALEVKAEDVTVLDVRGIAAFTDYLVIVSGGNTRQVKATAERIDDHVFKKFHRNPIGCEGKELAHWILLDYGDVIAHVFLEEERALYRLEDLWFDAKRVRFRSAAR